MSYLFRLARECASAVGVVVSAIYPPPVRVWDGADTLTEKEAEEEVWEPNVVCPSCGLMIPHGDECAWCSEPVDPPVVPVGAVPTGGMDLSDPVIYGPRLGGGQTKQVAHFEAVVYSPEEADRLMAGLLPTPEDENLEALRDRLRELSIPPDVPAGGEATPPEAVTAPPAGLPMFNAHELTEAAAEYIEGHMLVVLNSFTVCTCGAHFATGDTSSPPRAAWAAHVAEIVVSAVVDELTTLTDPVRAADLRVTSALNLFEQHRKTEKKDRPS